MSRIRTVVAKAQNIGQHQHEPDSCDENISSDDEKESLGTKDESENAAMRELAARLPRLGALFTLHRKVGEGTFSSVYVASLRRDHVSPSKRRLFAIKHLVGTAHPLRVEHEVRCLRDMGGQHHVVSLDLCLRHLDTCVIVMPYMPHTKFSEYMGQMDCKELASYCRALLSALRHVHSFGVIHRDVKPSNFLYDRASRRYQLIDFGLAQRITPPPPPPALLATNGKRTHTQMDTDMVATPAAKRAALGALQPDSERRAAPAEGGAASAGAGAGAGPKAAEESPCACSGVGGVCSTCASRAAMRAPRAGTQGFRPPEVLLKSPRQGPAVDVWAAGVVLCSVLCARYPLLRAGDDAAALAELAGLLGSARLRRAAHTMGRRLLLSVARPRLCLPALAARLRGVTGAGDGDAPPCGGPLCRCSVPQSCGFPSAAFSLCARLLEPDPALRPSAAHALDHPFLRDAL